jgi:hypothetical protein
MTTSVTSSRHGVAGIDGKVHEHLLQLTGVALDMAEVWLERSYQLDVLADDALEHFLRVDHQGVEVQHPGGHDLLAAERQQLTSKRGRPFSGAGDLFYQAATGVRSRQPLEQQIGAAGYDREQVVEVMRDSAGELAHRVIWNWWMVSAERAKVTNVRRDQSAWVDPQPLDDREQ